MAKVPSTLRYAALVDGKKNAQAIVYITDMVSDAEALEAITESAAQISGARIVKQTVKTDGSVLTTEDVVTASVEDEVIDPADYISFAQPGDPEVEDDEPTSAPVEEPFLLEDAEIFPDAVFYTRETQPAIRGDARFITCYNDPALEEYLGFGASVVYRLQHEVVIRVGEVDANWLSARLGSGGMGNMIFGDYESAEDRAVELNAHFEKSAPAPRAEPVEDPELNDLIDAERAAALLEDDALSEAAQETALLNAPLDSVEAYDDAALLARKAARHAGKATKTSTPRTPKTFNYQNLAGCIWAVKNRTTGAFIRLYHTQQAGFTCETPYLVRCDDHGYELQSKTQRETYDTFAHPTFCPKCVQIAQEKGINLAR